MNPEIAKTIAAEHHEELRQHMAESRRGPVRRDPGHSFLAFPKGWHVSWSRTVLSADPTHRRGSSLVIIISARRPALARALMRTPAEQRPGTMAVARQRPRARLTGPYAAASSETSSASSRAASATTGTEAADRLETRSPLSATSRPAAAIPVISPSAGR
jgi:hypothetical protein